MGRARNARLIAAGMLAWVLTAAAQPLPTSRPERVGLSPERLDRIAEFFNREVQAKRLPGAVVLVARKGRIAYHEAFGVVDPATGAPMPRDAVFRMWSMTKPLVSVAAMTLVEEGKLALNDPVSKYIPAFANIKVSIEKVDPETRKSTFTTVPAQRPVLVLDLMRHTAGIPYDYLARNAEVKQAYERAGLDAEKISSAEFASRIAAIPLEHQPGAAFQYGHATDILGHVLEVVDGMRLSDLLERRVLAPLGMRDTGFHVPPASKDRFAQPFAQVPGTTTPVKLFDPRTRPVMDEGGSRGVSTAGDYARFCQMLLNGGQLDSARILSRTSVRWMTSDHLVGIEPLGPGPGELTFGTSGYTFGLGLGLRRAAGGSAIPGSAGQFMWTGAFNNVFFVDPQEELIGIFLSVGTGSAIRRNHRLSFVQLVYQALVD